MTLSAPINVLRRKARLLSRENQIPLHEALDRVASQEGAASWSLLVSQQVSLTKAERIYLQIEPGDLVLIGARPNQGKTLLSLQVLAEAMSAGNKGFFFSLEYTETECRERFEKIGIDLTSHQRNFIFDGSDDICAETIIASLSGESQGTVTVIDYLQLLDQKRKNPRLADQISTLSGFAKARNIAMIFISQIDRRYNPSTKPFPGLEDLRLPNPLDLTLFDKAWFIQSGEVQFHRLNAKE